MRLGTTLDLDYFHRCIEDRLPVFHEFTVILSRWADRSHPVRLIRARRELRSYCTLPVPEPLIDYACSIWPIWHERLSHDVVENMGGLYGMEFNEDEESFEIVEPEGKDPFGWLVWWNNPRFMPDWPWYAQAERLE